jgi:hypothetical protein
MMPLDFDRAPASPVLPAAPAPSLSHISSFQRPYGPRIHRDENATSSAPASEPASFTSPTAAASFLAERRQKSAAPAVEPAATAESAEPEATADPESSQEGADPAEEPTLSEEPEGTDPVAEKLPPIERPRSWSKDDEDDWKALPRARQEKIAAREQARELEIRRGQNDTAEKLKGLTARETAAEQARQQYEERAKGALKVLEREQLRDFPDIKTMDDVKNLLAADPLRYLQWDAHQKEMVVADQAVKEASSRQATEKSTNWQKHVQAENELAIKAIPELGDKDKGAALQRRAAERLGELGFTANELNDLASGKEKISVYDHRFQQLIKAALDLTDLQTKVNSAKKAALVPAKTPVPPVQRPGVTQPRGVAESQRAQALDSKLNNSGSMKDALALLTARRNSQARRST